MTGGPRPAPPYGGRFSDVEPHLTVADGQDDTVLAEIASALSGSLPFTSQVSAVGLMAYDGTKWQERMSFPLRG